MRLSILLQSFGNMNKNSRHRAARDRKGKRTGASEVISQNARRNMEMRVVKGYDEHHIGFSRTIHCKIRSDKPANPKPRRDKEVVLTRVLPAASPIPGDGVVAS